MKRVPVLLLLVAVALCGFVCGALVLGKRTAGPGSDQPAYQRVLRTGIIRAGYLDYPPGTIVKTVGVDKREVSGFCVEILNEISKHLTLTNKITEAVRVGTMIEGLNNGRYETVAGPIWQNPARSKQALFSTPLCYSPVGIWVRSDDNRFTESNFRETINDPNVRIASLDGSAVMGIVKTDFPRADLKTYPESAGEPQLFLELMGRKVDVFIAEPVKGYYHLQKNPGSVKDITKNHPIRALPIVFILPKDEPQLKNMFDTTIELLQNSGFVEAVLKRYQPLPDAYFPIAKPYELPGNRVESNK